MTNIFDKCNNADMLHNNYKNLITNTMFNKGFNYELKKYIKCTNVVRNNFKEDCKIEANIFECLIAAIYIDKMYNYNYINEFIKNKTNINKLIKDNFQSIIIKDYKTRLQEYTTKNNLGFPKYKTIQFSKDRTISICIINNIEYQEVYDENKKKAEQKAAKLVLELLYQNI